MFTLMTQADVVKAIPVLAADAATVQERIHIIACSTLDHVRAHGDTTGCVALCNALPKGQRVKALGAWFKHFSNGKLIMAYDKKAGWSAKLSKGRVDTDFDVTKAMETTFADLTEERDPVSVTIESMLRNLKRNAENTEMHDDGVTPKVDPAARALAAEIVQFVRTKGLDQKKAA